MKIPFVAVGIFVLSALILFSVGMFLIGDRHKAFSHHEDLYTAFVDVNGLQAGSKVRVSGFDAGEVTSLEIPDRPSGKFRLKMRVDSKLRNLIRQDSFVTVETDGLVGDKFLLIHDGSDNAAEAEAGSTLHGKEPVELSEIINKVTGVMDQANATIGDLRGRLDGTVDAIHTTINHTDGMVANGNGLVSDARHGKGSVGMLLNDPQTAGNVRQAIVNTQEATANLNQVSVQAKQVMTDFQRRDLFQRAQDTLDNAKDASLNLDQTSQQVNATLKDALGPDHMGQTAGANLSETLSNVNLATANIADDTEALKHEFFFRGFFRKRGYYSLSDLTPDEYRANRYFQNPASRRGWLSATDVFTKDAKGNEILSQVGMMQIDQIVGEDKGSVIDRPVVIEGYADHGSNADEMAESRTRTLLVDHYLEKRFHLKAKNVGLMPLNATPPASTGKSSWDGACLVFPAAAK